MSSNSQNALATIDTAVDTIQLFLNAADTAGGTDPFVKFSKGKYLVGNNEIALGSKYVASMRDINHGWVKFVNQAKVDSRMGRIADGFVAEPRERLDDTDPSLWEPDLRGEPKDPWTLQWQVPLLDEKTGDGVVFATGSKGGQRAVGNLLRIYARNAHKGNPVVELGVRSYKHAMYGRVDEPDLKVAGWTSQPTPAAEMSDVIPF